VNGVTTDVPCACVTLSSSSTNNVLASGYFLGTATFYNSDGSPGATLTATGSTDGFIVKYNSSGDVTWATKISGSSSDTVYGIAIDSENNILVSGTVNGAVTIYNSDGSSGATLTATGNDGIIVKYDSSGTVTWATKIGGSSGDQGNGIAIDSANNILATGYFQGTTTFYNSDGSSGATLTATSIDGFIVKYDSSGTVTWVTKISGSSTDTGIGIATDSANNVLATGYFQGTATFYNSDGSSGVTLTAAGSTDAFIVKYDTSGTVTWATKIGGSQADAGNGIAIDSENNILATGYFRGTTIFYNSDGSSGATLTATGSTDGFIVKYNSSGTITWATKMGGSSTDEGRGIAIDSANNVLVTGYFQGTATFYNSNGSTGATLTATGDSDGFIVKYNSSGTITWVTKISGSSGDQGNGIAIDSANNILATGYFQGTTIFYNSDGSSGATLTATIVDGFIVKYDSSGTVTWATQIGGSSTEAGLGIAVR